MNAECTTNPPEPGTSDRDVARAILEGRARRLARPADEEPLASEFLEVLTFELGEERFGLETRFAMEVLRAREPTRLPGRSDALLGLVNRRGGVLAMMDARGVLGVGTRRAEADWMIVVGRESAEFGLVADDVREVVSILVERLHDPSGAAAIASTGLVRGVTSEGLIVLDGDALLASESFTIEDSEV